jgi:carbon storage regulator
LRERAFFVPILGDKKSPDLNQRLIYSRRRNMLVLTRKNGESIRIGENIEVTILSVKGARVRVGITCPREIAIRRGELEQQSTDSEVHDFVTCDEFELQLV